MQEDGSLASKTEQDKESGSKRERLNCLNYGFKSEKKKKIQFISTSEKSIDLQSKFEIDDEAFEKLLETRLCNKWVSLILCLLFGYIGGHKFYEGNGAAGIFYLCTLGLFGIGWVIDFISLLFKPNRYYVP